MNLIVLHTLNYLNDKLEVDFSCNALGLPNEKDVFPLKTRIFDLLDSRCNDKYNFDRLYNKYPAYDLTRTGY
jgi:hypothetical protein